MFNHEYSNSHNALSSLGFSCCSDGCGPVVQWVEVCPQRALDGVPVFICLWKSETSIRN